MSDDKITVYVMDTGDIHVGMTGRDEAPLALIIPKVKLGLGLTVDDAAALHDALCDALNMFVVDEHVEVPKSQLN